MFDIDTFKKINDPYGHDAGDAALKAAGEVLKNNLRKTDIVVRYGGDEFAAILEGVSDQAFRAISERLREELTSIKVPLALGSESSHIDVSVSMGAAALQKGQTPEYLARQADQALYISKRK